MLTPFAVENSKREGFSADVDRWEMVELERYRIWPVHQLQGCVAGIIGDNFSMKCVNQPLRKSSHVPTTFSRRGKVARGR